MPTSWDDYTDTTVSYSPAFIDTDTVYDSVHWDVTREGVEDYEELAMLKDTINKSHNAAWKANVQDVLDTAIAAVTNTWTGDYQWKTENNSGLADEELQKVQQALEHQ